MEGIGIGDNAAARRRRPRQQQTQHNHHGTSTSIGRAPAQSVLEHDQQYQNEHQMYNRSGLHHHSSSASHSPIGLGHNHIHDRQQYQQHHQIHIRNGAADISSSNSSNNKRVWWKRVIISFIISFILIWMTIMTLLVAELAMSEHNTGNSKWAAAVGNNGGGGNGGGHRDTLQSLQRRWLSTWRIMTCGASCWGKVYTYTDARTGSISVASVERIRRSTSHNHHLPRGPMFYATPSMLPYAPVISSGVAVVGVAIGATQTITTTAARRALQAQWQKLGVLDPMLRVKPGEEAAPQDHDKQPYIQGDCVPMQKWQVSSFPNCNAFHELNMMGSGRNSTVHRHHHVAHDSGGRVEEFGHGAFRDDNVHWLGRGWFRHAFKVVYGTDEHDPVVLKTLRLEREFYDEYYELHRKDAVAMERLTPSPYVIDIYGYCGQSAINELADFFTNFTNLQSFARQLQGNNDEHLLRLKLQISIMMSLGVAHIHEIDGPENATMVHYDVNPKNVAIVKGGKPKINDFNTVEFLRWNRAKQERCGFQGRLHEPWWRSPEELIMPRSYAEGRNLSSAAGLVDSMDDQPILDEKIDVWSLGNLLYNMLTGHAARGQARAWRYAQVREDVLNGVMPWREGDVFYLNSTNPSIVAMRRAVERCLVKDPKKRWSALDISYEMMDALEEILADNSTDSGDEGDDMTTNSTLANNSTKATNDRSGANIEKDNSTVIARRQKEGGSSHSEAANATNVVQANKKENSTFITKRREGVRRSHSGTTNSTNKIQVGINDTTGSEEEVQPKVTNTSWTKQRAGRGFVGRRRNSTVARRQRGRRR